MNAAKAKLKLAKVALDKAKIQEGFTRLRAEFDGVVAERNCDPGNFVQSGASGTRKPLLTLVRVDRLRVVVELAPYYAGVAERGDSVMLSVDGANFIGIQKSPDPFRVLQGNPKDFIAGKIARICPIIGPSGNRTVVIEMANPKNRLVPGASIGVQIIFNKTRVPDALTLPLSCVIRQDGKDDFVYVVRDGKAHIRNIKIGNILGRQCDVIEGIQAIDLVILKPGDFNDGTPVKIEKTP